MTLNGLVSTLEFLKFDDSSLLDEYKKYSFRNSVVCIGEGFVNITRDRDTNLCLMPNDCIVFYAEGEKTTVANINGVFDSKEVKYSIRFFKSC